MCKNVVCLVVILGLCGVTLAGPSWTGATGDGLWTTNLNWDSGTAPATGSTPIVRSAYYTQAYYPTYSTGTSNYGQLIVGYPDAGGLFEARLDMTGGSITTGSLWISFGWDTSYKGVINMSGGTINATSEIRLGYYGAAGTLNMSGGLLSIPSTGSAMMLGPDGGKGTVNLSGGTIDVPYLGIYAGSIVDVSGTGKIIVNDTTGMFVDVFGGYAASNQLIGNHVADDGQLSIVWNGVDKTTITAIPEPATMLLLGLGGLSLVRRKK